ncbi:MAG: 4Fe-4S binding protein, partial [Candidatus Omnitrophica bacterium]|nr:4Fe-4S binding protein [Candidatus Omnitrophota bacterium]
NDGSTGLQLGTAMMPAPGSFKFSLIHREILRELLFAKINGQLYCAFLEFGSEDKRLRRAKINILDKLKDPYFRDYMANVIKYIYLRTGRDIFKLKKAASVSDLVSREEVGTLQGPVQVAIINQELCRRCGKCLGQASCDYFEYSKEKNAISINSTKCSGCGACMVNCPYHAIKMMLVKEPKFNDPTCILAHDGQELDERELTEEEKVILQELIAKYNLLTGQRLGKGIVRRVSGILRDKGYPQIARVLENTIVVRGPPGLFKDFKKLTNKKLLAVYNQGIIALNFKLMTNKIDQVIAHEAGAIFQLSHSINNKLAKLVSGKAQPEDIAAIDQVINEALPKFTQLPVTGTYYVRKDPKNRFTLPVVVREDFGDSYHVFISNGALHIYPTINYIKMLNGLVEEKRLRLAACSCHSTLDGQGRLSLGKETCSAIGVEVGYFQKKLRLVGVIDHLELSNSTAAGKQSPLDSKPLALRSSVYPEFRRLWEAYREEGLADYERELRREKLLEFIDQKSREEERDKTKASGMRVTFTEWLSWHKEGVIDVSTGLLRTMTEEDKEYLRLVWERCEEYYRIGYSLGKIEDGILWAGVCHARFNLSEFKLKQGIYAMATSDAAVNVLLVDDSEAFRIAIGENLRGMGFKVLEAKDGVEGLKRSKVEKSNLNALIEAMESAKKKVVGKNTKGGLSLQEPKPLGSEEGSSPLPVMFGEAVVKLFHFATGRDWWGNITRRFNLNYSVIAPSVLFFDRALNNAEIVWVIALVILVSITIANLREDSRQKREEMQGKPKAANKPSKKEQPAPIAESQPPLVRKKPRSFEDIFKKPLFNMCGPVAKDVNRGLISASAPVDTEIIWDISLPVRGKNHPWSPVLQLLWGLLVSLRSPNVAYQNFFKPAIISYRVYLEC